MVQVVLQSRCSSFFAKNIWIGDILCQNWRRKFYRLQKMGLGQLKFSVPLLPRHEVRVLIQRMQLLIWKRVQLNVQLMMTILERFVKSFFIFKHHSSCYIWWKKTKATCIICRKESKGLGPFKSRYTRHSIAANMSLLVKKCIFIGKNMYRITQCKLKKTCSKLMLFGQWLVWQSHFS